MMMMFAGRSEALKWGVNTSKVGMHVRTLVPVREGVPSGAGVTHDTGPWVRDAEELQVTCRVREAVILARPDEINGVRPSSASRAGDESA
jgi:hypothetical protein